MTFLQLASDLRDTGLLQLLHARLLKNQNLTQHVADKVTEMHEDLVKQIRAKTQWSATLPSSDTIVQQMPLKPAVFHGRDVIIEEITQLLIKEGLYSRRRWDGKDFSCTGRCRTIYHKGMVSTRKHRLGTLH